MTEIYEVEKVLDHRPSKCGYAAYKSGKIKEYYVKWKNYPMSESTWEDAVKKEDEIPDLVTCYWEKKKEIQKIISGKNKTTKRTRTEEPAKSSSAKRSKVALKQVTSVKSKPRRKPLETKQKETKEKETTPKATKSLEVSNTEKKYSSDRRHNVDKCKKKSPSRSNNNKPDAEKKYSIALRNDLTIKFYPDKVKICRIGKKHGQYGMLIKTDACMKKLWFPFDDSKIHTKMIKILSKNVNKYIEEKKLDVNDYPGIKQHL